MSFVEKVEARSSVEIADSCNCTQCCPRNCGCWPRRVKRQHGKPNLHHANTMPNLQTQGELEITATGIKVHTASMPVLTESGKWEVEIDGVKQGIK